ncbi:MAG: geranylgeranylglycerol-phosphate geranylgeranyltransferase [Candidatus Latescibacterota bacterium]|nr:MAG: geranylgeranylglycerol-phosphate geranylgeranyltransferase [Candidatus Latescibacterota bacterium]
MMSRTLAFLWNRFEITRPHNLAVAALMVVAGWAAAGGGAPDERLLLAAVAAALVAAAGNVVNDYFDAEIDRINKPRRPIPSGRIGRGESRHYYALLTLMALVTGFAAGAQMLVMVALWTVALFFYSAELKSRLLLGNVTVSVVCASGFVAGAWVAGRPVAGTVPAILAFLLLMGREIVKDVEDLRGDRALGARTLARRLGARRALGVAFVFFLLFAALAPWPYWMQLCGRGYLLTYVFGIFPLLLVACWLMFRDTSPGNLVRVSWILKIDMFVGVLGFYLGQAR